MVIKTIINLIINTEIIKFCQKEELNDELEDIKEEEDEGKRTTSNNKDWKTKKVKEYINIDDIDFTGEDIINLIIP